MNFKDFKIKQLMYAIVVVVIVSTLFITGFGYLQLKKINSNVDKVYSNNLIPITDVSSLRKNVMSMRLSIVKSVWSEKYDSVEARNADIMKNEIIKSLEVYEGSITQQEGKQLNSKLESSLDAYFQFWEKVKTEKSNGQSLSDAEKAEFSSRGAKVVEILNSIVDFNNASANATKESSNGTYSASIRLQFTVGGALLIIIILIMFVILKIISKNMNEIEDLLSVISKGDMSIKINTEGKNEFSSMRKSLFYSVEGIKGILTTIKDSAETLQNNAESLSAISEEMTSAAQGVAGAVQEVAEGAASQAEDLAVTSSNINKFGEDVEGIVNAITNIDISAKEISNMSKESNNDMEKLAGSISEIRRSFDLAADKIRSLGNNVNKVHDITSLINSIADQTNLLALNAAIEAARAGESGKGFAVVAEEIRKLAEQSKSSSSNIQALLNNILEETDLVVDNTSVVSNELASQTGTINNTIDSFKNIIAAINRIIPSIDDVSKSAEKINQAKDDIQEKVETVSSVAEETSAESEGIAASVQEISASGEEVSAAAQSLEEMILRMVDNVGKFKLK